MYLGSRPDCGMYIRVEKIVGGAQGALESWEMVESLRMHVVAGKRPPCWIEIESEMGSKDFQIRQIALFRNHRAMMDNLRVAGEQAEADVAIHRSTHALHISVSKQTNHSTN